MKYLTLDNILGIIIVIGGFIALLLSLIPKSLRDQLEIRDRKGHIISISTGRLNKWGILLVVVSTIATVCGVFKAIRDNDTQGRLGELQTQSINAQNDLRDTVSAYKAENTKGRQLDSIQFNKFLNAKFNALQNMLKPKGLGLDANWSLTSANNRAASGSDVFIGSGAHIGSLDIRNNKFYHSPKTKADTSKIKE